MSLDLCLETQNFQNSRISRWSITICSKAIVMYNHQSYQLDIYRDPCHPRCRGLMLLETFTTLPISQLRANLPPFLAITEEVTGDPAFSMYNLALRSEWSDNTKDFCHSLSLPVHSDLK